MIVHLVDGTYELFRHFYGLRRAKLDRDSPFGAVIGVLHTVLKMIEDGASHVGVATDHVIESFRNDLWPGYKTGEGIEPALAAMKPGGAVQFERLGYFCLDTDARPDRLVFNRTVGLRDTWSKLQGGRTAGQEAP